LTTITKPDRDRRVAFTGIGVVAPTGLNAADWWQATTEGRSGIGPITRFDTSKYAARLAGEVDGFEATDYIDQRLIVQTDRWTHMALAAAQMAFEDSKFDPTQEEPYSMSVITASSSGGNEFGQKEIQNLWGKGPIYVGAYQSIAWFYAATTGQIGIKHGMKGASGVVLAEGAGGLEALAHARRAIRRGIETVVSGGLEAPIGPYALACQLRNGRLSLAEKPEDAYRPFDARANGYVMGEGGAIIMAENLARARERGAPLYGELAGYGATNDAYHYGNPDPDPRQYARAMSIALEDAGVGPDEVDVVFADAAGVPEDDALEVAAIKQVFRHRAGKVPVTAPKAAVGNLYAGAAPLDVAAALLAMRDGVIPPTINLDQPADGSDLDFVTGTAREAPVDVALVAARGYGGFNAAVVLRRIDSAGG